MTMISIIIMLWIINDGDCILTNLEYDILGQKEGRTSFAHRIVNHVMPLDDCTVNNAVSIGAIIYIIILTTLLIGQ